uniref:MADS transcription factor SEP2 n=1 Tax=Delphinium anthriscifolium TaxID=215072 RepID=A0A977THM9_9MAGN|nr:MADS transcription factor SEP2 [Delphinium anthriscifolium]
MGRGKVELKRIENKINRQVTFAKRRNGLLKKAYELSILCDAEVALIIFSPRGKLFEFSSNSSMVKILDKYQEIIHATLEVNMSPKGLQQSTYEKYMRLKVEVEVLQQIQSNLLGEELSSLSTKELEKLEHQLENSLKNVRSTKSNLLEDQLFNLQIKEQALQEANDSLRTKLEKWCTENTIKMSWKTCDQNITYIRQPVQTKKFFQPLEYNLTFDSRYNVADPDQMLLASPSEIASTSFLVG